MPTTVTVLPWPDSVIDQLGFDPRSNYAERFWLPTLGPTSLLLTRRLATEFDRAPEGMTLPVAETSQALGLGPREGANAPLARSFERLVQFDVARVMETGTYAVRRMLPPINRRHLKRLPPALQTAHTEWAEAQLAEPPAANARRRARRLAIVLLEQGEDPDPIEQLLMTTGFHPSICRETIEWARNEHAHLTPAPVSP
ncbi:MAG: hypothetical protein JWL73_1732 [Actinomycetia bacterium]|nr:hypothetical protein [Actinomycetes bacterium]